MFKVRAHMLTLGQALPEFVAQVEASLSAMGRTELVGQLAGAIIGRCTCEPEHDAAYIYIVAPTPSIAPDHPAPVAETLVFYAEHGYNIDLDHEGQLLGIELLDRPDIVLRLKAAKAL
jgi:hypothetical protein